MSKKFTFLQAAKEYRITPREIDVARLLGKGKPRKNIADSLQISVRTVDVHLARLRDKLDVSTSFELSFLFSHYR